MADELEGNLIMDAKTFLAAGGAAGARPTSTVWFKTTAAAVLSIVIPRPLALVYVNGNGGGLISRVSDSYATQTTPAGLSSNIIAFFTASIFAICNAEFQSGDVIYMAASTGLQGTCVFAEISTA